MLAKPMYVVVNSLLDTRFEKKTGIPRVEYEVAKYLMARGAKAVAWRGRQFISIDFDAVIGSIDQNQSLDLDTICQEPTKPGAWPRLGFPLARALHPLARRAPSWMKLSRVVDRLLAVDWPKLSPAERHATTDAMGFAHDFRRQAQFLEALTISRTPSPKAVSLNHRASFEKDSTMVLLGSFWSDRPFKAIEALKASRDMRLVAMIYDLLPIRRPEFFDSPSFCAAFRRHIDHVLKLADAVCAISHYVARDVTAYAVESGVAAVRPVTAIPLCSDMNQSTPIVHSKRLRETDLRPDKFVVLVSSINGRKNHRWAYQMWRRAVEEMGEQVPTLVFAGQDGGDGAALRIMSQDSLMWERKLRFIESPTDGELGWLYANCAFTIFPSHAEGWGLPITESLSYGKYCLAADNTSLPEAGQGLAFHADHLDGKAWLAEIRRLVDEPGYREAANARVVAGFRARTWEDVGAEILDRVEFARASPSIEAARAQLGG